MTLLTLVDGAKALKQKDLPEWVFVNRDQTLQTHIDNLNTILKATVELSSSLDDESDVMLNSFFTVRDPDPEAEHGSYFTLYDLLASTQDLSRTDEELARSLGGLCEKNTRVIIRGLMREIKALVKRLGWLGLYNTQGHNRYEVHAILDAFVVFRLKVPYD